ncbi:hypothetical protein F4815DRAFT_28778 [Daldinia loculata]|nr:hypothetical protein F4815DRAFT_28778 [Daldinia loculata]
MARKNKKRQTQLTFESTGASSSPGQATPANVRLSKNTGASSSPGRASPAIQATRSSDRSKKRQSKLRGTVGLSQNTTSPARPPPASFMPKLHDSKRPVVGDDSDSETEVPDQEEGDNVPVKSSQSVSTRLQNTVIDDDDDDDDDEPIAPPSMLKRRRPPVIALDDSDEDEDEDDDDRLIVPPSSLKRPRPRFIELEDSSNSDASPVKKRKTSVSTPGRLKRPTSLVPSSPTKRGAPKGHRSEKQKKMELLRRRRAGEKIEKLTSSEDSDEEKRGLYDTDPEEEFVVLKDFDDEESEGEEQEKEEKPAKRLRRKEKEVVEISQEDSQGDVEGQEDGDDDDKDLEDFISDDDDAPLGAPANLDIPLEFTAQAHRPLKDQFPYVIEWLVHNRINPAFERNDPVYNNAWRKLDDEIRALASSKFASAAWKAEFYRTLKGRPKMEAYEMDRSERSGGLYDSCDACGRSNHPASFRIIFQGHPYYKSTLADVESDTEDNDSNEDEDDDDDNESNAGSIDTQGMTLPPVTREWHVGVVCCSNAETAHSLIHWKHALKEWVEERLEDDGWMAAHKLKERERLKARKRRDLANGIVDGWREKGIVAALYKDFKSTLESARNKTTGGRGRGRFR